MQLLNVVWSKRHQQYYDIKFPCAKMKFIFKNVNISKTLFEDLFTNTTSAQVKRDNISEATDRIPLFN